MNKIKIKSN